MDERDPDREKSGPPAYQRDQIRREAGLEREEDAEFAAEAAPPLIVNRVPVTTQENVEQSYVRPGGRAMGYFALVLALLSLFFAPALLGSAATLLGFFSFVQGSRALGVWSIVIGLISLAGYFLLVPLYA
ncbi:hypothetical protein [Paenibacillus hamazuiensis]|uniref:hypothetical protein n=1 Tax=Paenibacillus hamazuiensis TaxID=2936508 RepID=UPI00200CC595|nr:hypothetical protein [Paenibacillus hamazuiensis]